MISWQIERGGSPSTIRLKGKKPKLHERDMEPIKKSILLILIAAVLLLCLTFSVLIFSFPPGMDYGAALYVNSILAMFIVVVAAIVLIIPGTDRKS